MQLQSVTVQPGVQPVSNTGGNGASRMLSNSLGPVNGAFRPSSLGKRQSECPANPVAFKVVRKIVEAVPSGLFAPVLPQV